MIAVVVVGRLSGQGTRHRRGGGVAADDVWRWKRGIEEPQTSREDVDWQRGGTGSELAKQRLLLPH